MIITVTLNPALDRKAAIDGIQPGKVNRLREVSVQVGGKGINVSRMVLALGGISTAVGFAGGATGELLLRMLHDHAISPDFVITQGITRENLKITDGSGLTTEFNEPGSPVAVHEMELLVAKLLCRGRRGSYFVLAGSLPEGSESTTYRDIIGKLKNTKSTVLLDTAGQPLADSVNAGVDVLKVNRREFCEFMGAPDNANESLLYQGAKELCARGLELVVVTLGRDGALFVTREEVYRAKAPIMRVASRSGAGDCMMGGIVYGLENGMPLPDIVRVSTASAACAVSIPGPAMPDLAMIRQMEGRVEIQKAK